jgi:hypothetical protein
LRAVALSDSVVQEKVARSFIPLKVEIKPGSEDFPLDWPALHTPRGAYPWSRMGFTGCNVVSPDLAVEYGNSGLGAVHNLFDSIGYDAEKFAAMLDLAALRWDREQATRADETLDDIERIKRLTAFRAEIGAILARDGTFLPPPKGFTIIGAIELSELGSGRRK